MTNSEDVAPTVPEAAHANRLIHEKSPYLLQHAHNPVDWYAWGDAAFAKARSEDKPIFLSIGYYTCHWCHVMERESFEDATVAEVLNRDFVSIKVDREERPDIDRIYMSFIQATTGSGGWPMSVFLTPELKPFFGGTYFPPDDRYGRPGFASLLQRLAAVWKDDRQRVLSSAEQVTTALTDYAASHHVATALPDARVLDRLYEQLASGYDAVYGGFGNAPKFPRPVVLNFLLRFWKRSGEARALEMVLATLRAMAKGGMCDQLGGGFHRYSVDSRWHVPHFEKMLYDQAQLAISYSEAFQISRDEQFAEVARETIDFVLREMRSPEGGFYSAQDADSQVAPERPERAEGAFYVWTAEELERRLGGELAAIVAYRYGVEPHGNVAAEVDAHGEMTGKNVLYQQHSVEETAQHFGQSVDATREQLARARSSLFEGRAQRPRPPTDDKVVTSWNGLMISASARASQVLSQPAYLTAALECASFLHQTLYKPGEQVLYRRYRAGEVAIPGFADDYAFLVQGLIDLYEATFDTRWLLWAVELQQRQDAQFWDNARGGYFATTGSDPSVLLRMREDYDGAEPSPNSVAASNLLRLARLTDNREWRAKAEQTIGAFGTRLETLTEALPQMAVALDLALATPTEIVIAGEPGAEDTNALLATLRRHFLPHSVILLADGGRHQQQLGRWLPFLSSLGRQNGRATAYVCQNYACQLPVTSPEELARMLNG